MIANLQRGRVFMDMQLTDRELVELLEYSKDGLMISDDKGKIII